MTSQHLAEFTNRVAPGWLKDGAPIPAGWSGGEADWRELIEQAREHFALRSAFDFAEGIASLGWRDHELARGVLDTGAEQRSNGMIVRRVSTAPQSFMARAGTVLQEARALHLSLDPLLDIEGIAAGRTGGEVAGERKLLEAERVVRAAKAQAVHERREVESLPVIEVGVRFRMLGREWEPGRHRISNQQLRDLRQAVAQGEAQRDQRGWSKVEGFSVWPPFVLVSPAEVDA